MAKKSNKTVAVADMTVALETLAIETVETTVIESGTELPAIVDAAEMPVVETVSDVAETSLASESVDAAPATYADMIASVDAVDVSLCLSLIADEFADRETFERSRSADGTLGNAFNGARKAIEGNRQVATMLCALNVDVRQVVNRSRNGATRANLYALHKLSNLARYAAGETKALDKVTLAFLTSLIVFQRESGTDATFDTDKQETALTRAQAYRGLAQHVVDALNDSATRATMSGGKATQASQCRTMLENIGALERVDLHSVRVDLSHALIAQVARRMNIVL